MKKLSLVTCLFAFSLTARAQQPHPWELCAVGHTLYIIGSTQDGDQLWKKEGDCFFHLKDFQGASNLIELNGALFFAAKGKDQGDYTGRELWRSDGTHGGTYMVKDINAYSSSNYTNDSDPSQFRKVNNTLFFTAFDGHHRQLWKTDGSGKGTVMVKNLITWDPSYADPISDLTAVNNELFFSVFTGPQTELWKTDGTENGTVRLKAFPGFRAIRNFTNGNGILYFAATDGQNGVELWKSDGTTSGTNIVKDIYLGAQSSSPKELTFINGTLFFSAADPTNGRELWSSDGTSQGTTIYQDLVPGIGDGNPIGLISALNDLYFVTWASGNAAAPLCKVDLANHVVTKLHDFVSDPHTYYFTQINNELFFVANDGIIGDVRLWVTDGSTGGTKIVLDNNTPGSVYELKALDDKLYFTARGNINEYSLWQTDGVSLSNKELTIAEKQSCTSQISYTFYPNPVIDYLLIGGKVQIVGIYDFYGRTVSVPISYFDDSVRLDFTALTPGQYFARCMVGNSNQVLKLVKK